MLQLTRLVYSSRHRDLQPETVDDILEKSRINNLRDGITGALIVSDRSFMQLLEGERDAVAKCLLRLLGDPRHDDIRILCAGDAEHRLFAGWSMHLIQTSGIKREILSRYEIDGSFAPEKMTQAAIEDLCKVLSKDDWEEIAA
ncbi:blue light sensor protein [Thioclava sp. NG1]|nr:blue light sensor protein [Thioclava sp. NG1]